MKYKFILTRKSIYGHQAEREYFINGEYFNARIMYFGNQGFDVPCIIRTNTRSDYFHSLNSFMKEFYKGNLDEIFSSCKDGMKITFELERYF